MNAPATESPLLRRLTPWLLGGVLGLALVKFGNPGLFSELVTMPSNLLEWIFFTWPPMLGYWVLGGVAVVGFLGADWREVRWRWPLALLGCWLAWQFVAAMDSVSPELTAKAIPQFVAATVCFGLGYAAIGRRSSAGGMWFGLLVGFALVIASGWQQHFGGLEETRRRFYVLYTQGQNVSPELLKRMSSHRIFATLFYPNTLAGVVILLLPGCLAYLWAMDRHFTKSARLFLMGAIAVGALGCLVWSGSKGGWLIFLGLLLIAALQLPFPRKWKYLVLSLALLAGLGGFFWRYSGYFQKGATSVGARFEYWRAALTTTIQHPVNGTGPGTFGPVFERTKPPGAEMARLTHNDFLQQASDAGLPAATAYLGFMVWALWAAYPRSSGRTDWLRFAAWLGMLGWAVQSAMEFNLYIPAISWPAFALLGWLVACEPATPRR